MNDMLDPSIRAAMELTTDTTPSVDWLNGSPQQLRAAYEAARQPAATIDPPPQSVEFPAPHGTLRALLFGDLDERAVLYFHGGGWIVGSSRSHAAIGAALFRACGHAVLLLDYRLAPEHPAPAPVDDGVTATQWLVSQGASRILLAGDSAGAAIALATELAIDPQLTTIAGCLCFYGAFGLSDSLSMRLFQSREEGLDRHAIARLYRDAYGATEENLYDAERLATGRAPLWLLAAGMDPFRDDSLCLAELATRAGRAVTLECKPGVPHAYLHYVGRARAADETIAAAARWMKGVF